MSLALTDLRLPLNRSGARSGKGKAVFARATDSAVRLAGQASWPRLAGAAALGFVVGVAALGGRKVLMQATTGVAGDWFAALKADHKLVDTLFGLLLDTKDQEKAKRHLLFSKIAYALAKHQFEEEHVVYPALRERDGTDSPKHLDAEHFDMKSFVHELLELPKDDPKWLSRARALHRLIQAHVREEEEIVFPRLHQKLTARENLHLTRAMHREGLKLA